MPATFLFYGGTSNFFDLTFFGNDGLDSLEVTSHTSTRLVMTNTDTGFSFEATGSGIAFHPSGEIAGGIFTGVHFRDSGGALVADLTGISWNFIELDVVLQPIETPGHTDPFGALATLLSAQDWVVDASGATSALDMDRALFGQLAWVTSAVTVTGSPFGDVLMGSFAADVLAGGPGDDTLYGYEANDTLWGGSGNNDMYGGTGDDILGSGDGDDALGGGGGNDTLWAGGGNDMVTGDDGADEIWSGQGDDTVEGGYGSDLLGGLAGADDLLGEAGQDTIYAGDGADIANGGEGDDTLWGGAGNDSLNGGAESDLVAGGAGNDTLTGGAGDDEHWGGAGADVLVFATGDGDDFAGGFSMAEGDRLSLDDALWAGHGVLTAAQVVSMFGSDAGNHMVLTFDGGESLTLGWLAGVSGLESAIDIF